MQSLSRTVMVNVRSKYARRTIELRSYKLYSAPMAVPLRGSTNLIRNWAELVRGRRFCYKAARRERHFLVDCRPFYRDDVLSL